MKKIIIFIIIVIAIVACVGYVYVNYRAQYKDSLRTNREYEQYLNKEVLGSDLATIMNKAVDNNKQNKVEKNKGIYVNNGTNSINIEIKMLDDDNEIYKMEKIYDGGMQNFMTYYGNIKFKCTKLDYHKRTHRVSYMLFEQLPD